MGDMGTGEVLAGTLFFPHKSSTQKGLTDMCEAFLHGKEHTTWQAVRSALILPLAVMLFFFHLFSVH